jgi:hypothetical protein
MNFKTSPGLDSVQGESKVMAPRSGCAAKECINLESLLGLLLGGEFRSRTGRFIIAVGSF